MPGALPVLNTAAVDHAVRVGLAVGGRIRGKSVFARKQYFYPDLPKGYQITQFDLPYCEGGAIVLASGRAVELIRIHLEEDAGKSLHGGGVSLVDLNRAGMPLIEIVSQPAIRSAEEASDYLRRLRSIVRHVGASDGNMEEGSLRCDANVSLRRAGATTLGTRSEIKNLNSFKNLERAIGYEIERQRDILAVGGSVQQETRLFDADSGRTEAMRSKEDSPDYRYVPDPDLPPLLLASERIESLGASLPELPEAMATRFTTTLGLTPYDAQVLTSDKDLAAYFEAALAAATPAVTAKMVANWVTGEVLSHARSGDWSFASPPLPAPMLGQLLALVGDDTISGKAAKAVLDEMVRTGDGPLAIVDRLGLRQVRDESAITTVIDAVIDAHPGQLQDYLAGKEKLVGFFVGQVMRRSAGSLDPALVNRLLIARLQARRDG